MYIGSHENANQFLQGQLPSSLYNHAIHCRDSYSDIDLHSEWEADCLSWGGGDLHLHSTSYKFGRLGSSS